MKRNNNNHHHHHARGAGKRSGDGEDRDLVPKHLLDRIQSFGNTPEEIARWKQERRSNFPTSAGRKPAITTTVEFKQEKEESSGNALGALFSGYASESDEVEGEIPIDDVPFVLAAEATAVPSSTGVESTPHTAAKKSSQQPCRYFARNGKCKNGQSCTYAHIPPREEGQQSLGAKRSKQQQQHEGAARTTSVKFSKQELLDKLFASESKQEKEILLQCFYHLLATNAVAAS